MRPHPRIRKTVKWGGAAVTVLLGTASIGSGWIAPEWTDTSGSQYGVWAGRVYFMERNSPGYRPGWCRFDQKVGPGFNWAWWLHIDKGPMWGWRICVPLWVPGAASLVATVGAWRLDALARRRDRAGLNLCPNCHYDRAGLAPGAKCPECGARPASV